MEILLEKVSASSWCPEVFLSLLFHMCDVIKAIKCVQLETLMMMSSQGVTLRK